MTFRVLIDACALLPYQLCDLLLRLGETDIYQPLWSDQILEEVRRNLVTSLGRTEQQAFRRVGQMRTAFPNATVSGYKALVPVMTNDPKDRHVLAAAIHGQAALIVTANLKDFPAEALAPYGIEAVHPDEFLLDQLDLYPRQTIQCLQEQRAAYRSPSFTPPEFYNSLRHTAPQFADVAEGREGAGTHQEPGPGINGSLAPVPLPAALEIVDEQDAREALFPDGNGPNPYTPLGAAVLWYAALQSMDMQRGALEELTYDPSDWDGFTSAKTSLENWALMQNTHFNKDDPDNIAYIRFMPDAGWNMRAFAEVSLPEVRILTLVKCPDRWWRVWGISTNYQPSANRVRHGTED